jgi:hypothetical protein
VVASVTKAAELMRHFGPRAATVVMAVLLLIGGLR